MRYGLVQYFRYEFIDRDSMHFSRNSYASVKFRAYPDIKAAFVALFRFNVFSFAIFDVLIHCILNEATLFFDSFCKLFQINTIDYILVFCSLMTVRLLNVFEFILSIQKICFKYLSPRLCSPVTCASFHFVTSHRSRQRGFSINCSSEYLYDIGLSLNYYFLLYKTSFAAFISFSFTNSS